jgi:hypothetical protein
MQATVVAVKDQVSCETHGEAVILHLHSGVYYGLNAVGAWVWNFVQVPRTVEEIRRGLLERYEVEDARCALDLDALLHQLSTAELIEIRPASND